MTVKGTKGTHYLSQWFPSQRYNYCQVILDLCMEYTKKVGTPEYKQRRHSKLNALLGKYVALTYLLGTRRGELLGGLTKDGKPMPNPSISFLPNMVRISHYNSKHKSPHDTVSTVVPYCCQAGNRLWAYVSNNYTQESIRHILLLDGITLDPDTPKERHLDFWPTPQEVSTLVKHHFRLRLSNPDTKESHVKGLPIHNLRHYRCYHLLYQANRGKGYRPAYCQRYFGWLTPAMMLHYSSIRGRMSEIEAELILKADGSLVPRSDVGE